MNISSRKKFSFIAMLLLSVPSTALGQQTRLAWIKGIFRNPAKVGAIAPCSSYVAITDFNPTKKYDVIVSTLPFNSLPPALVQQIVKQYAVLIKSGGYATYIEYIALGRVKRRALNGQKRAAWDTKQATLKAWRKKYGIGRTVVLRNLPPAYVYQLQM